MPEVIVIDEIGTEAEAQAARTIAERGVQLVGTAHGTNLENIMLNPTLSDLIGGIQSVTLSDEEARRRGTQKSILERKAPPTFDVVVEIQSWAQVAVHLDVADTIDSILRGRPVVPQIRFLDEAGNVKAEEAVRPPTPISSLATRDEEPIFPVRVAPVGATGGPLRSLRIYPYGASINRLEQAVRELQLPVQITKNIQEADAVLTVKASYRKKPAQIRDAEDSGLPVYVLRSNTVIQMEQALANMYDLDVPPDTVQEAIEETEDAVNRIMAKTDDVVDLTPQNAYVRKLQHEVAERYNLKSSSFGRDPHRRVRLSHE
jgi:succinyl-CoA synthetase alpha subunit